MQLRFRRADATSAQAILALERRVSLPRIYEARTSIGEVLKEIVANSFFLIEDTERIIGSISFRPLEPTGVYIGNMAVDPAARRRGTARAALQFVFDRTRGASRWELVTHPDNSAAIMLYTSAGFAAGETLENYFGDGQPRMRMVRLGAGG